MVSQDKLIKQGIYLTDSLFDEIIRRLAKGIRSSDTLEDFLNKTKDYTMNNPLVVTGYKDDMLEIILKETNNHKFSRPSQKELTRLTIENRVGDLIVDVGDDIKDSVRDIVKHGYNNKLSQDEIAENITKKVTTIKNKRARTIARTEIARTATASDYVINRERGATHFTVDCRKTCCKICARKYDFGNIEYSIEQVDMLPPRHPNCRCYAMFFKKEGHEIIKSQTSFDLNFKNNSNTSYNGKFIKLIESKIPKYLPAILITNMLSFDEHINNNKWNEEEYAYIINLTNEEVSDYVTMHDENHVHMDSNDLTFYEEDHAISTHSHVGLEPFNYKDFYDALKNKDINMDAMIVHTPQDIFIVEFNENAKYNLDVILNETKKDYDNMMKRKMTHPTEEFGAEALWNNYLNNELLTKYMEFRRVSK